MASELPQETPLDLKELQTLYIGRGCHETLSADQEIALAQIIAAGKTACQELLQDKEAAAPLTASHRIELERARSDGDRAVEVFVAANHGLVKKIVGFVLLNCGPRVDFDDLQQVGLQETLRCVHEFDPSLGHKFSTYAYPNVRSAITTWIADNGRTIRRSRGMAGKISQYDRLVDGGMSPAQTAAELQLSIETLESHREAQKRPDAISYHTPVSADGKNELLDIIHETADGTEVRADEQIIDKLAAQMFCTALKQWLTAHSERHNKNRGTSYDHERAFKIAMDYHGHGQSYERIARTYGISRARVQQIISAVQYQVAKNLPAELRKTAVDMGLTRHTSNASPPE